MGPKKLVIQAGTMGTIIPPRAASELVDRYRKSFPAVPMLWQSIDVGVKGLIRGRHEVFTAGRCTFTINPSRTMLRIELPSGRVLRYFKPRIDSENRIVYQDRNGPVHCWGGFLTENVTQAIAGDLKTDFMIRCDEANFHAVIDVHDEVVFEEYEEIAELVLRESLVMLSQTPEWLDVPGLIKGEGKISPRYTK
jgi:DNA polymerase